MNPAELIDHLNEETEFLAEFKSLQSDVECLVSSETHNDIGSNLVSIIDQLSKLQKVAAVCVKEWRKHRTR